MNKKSREIEKESENEYKNWFWSPYQKQWIWAKPQSKSWKKQKSQLKIAFTEVRNTPELVAQDMRKLFCRGRYRSWEVS